MLKTFAARVRDGRLEIADGATLPDGEAHVTVETRADGTSPNEGDPGATSENLPRLRSPRLASPEDAEFFRKTVRRIDPTAETSGGEDA